MGDIFGMFGGGPRGGGGKQKVRVKPIGEVVQVTLEDVYNGKTLNLNVDRQRLCKACGGVGGTDKTAVQSCSGCKGSGMKTVLRQMGPGMYSQSRGPCDDCNGQGEIIDMSKRCKTCKGKKIQKEKKKLSVEMDKGSPQDCQYTIHGEGNEVPDAEPGNVIAQIKIK